METGDRDEWDTVTRFRDEQLCSEEDRLLVDINVRTLDMNGSILDDLVKLLFRPSNRVPGYISTAYLCKVEFGATWGTPHFINKYNELSDTGQRVPCIDSIISKRIGRWHRSVSIEDEYGAVRL